MSWSVEIESLVSADRMFKAAILDWHNLGPEIAPEVFVSASNEGNLRQFNFTSGMPFNYVKERLDVVDHQAFECESTITEGGHLGTKLETASVTYKIVNATGGSRCVVKVVTTYKSLPGFEINDKAAEIIDKAKEAVVKHFKTVETYLLANPDKYNNVFVTEIGDGDNHSRGVVMLQSNGTVSGNAVQQSGNVVHLASVMQHSGHVHHSDHSVNSAHHHSGHVHDSDHSVNSAHHHSGHVHQYDHSAHPAHHHSSHDGHHHHDLHHSGHSRHHH